ncbi:glycerate kinase [Leucobacter salsicius]|uniref:glycerate kinase n=1 Tax=Leucobacter salsicius TaxID=664638 RepID=UPI0003496C44|nr:glycerate kinase [Leucobacter salsicius]
MRIVIAPDKFKGSLSADAVCAHLAAGITAALPGARIDVAPMADGGEGTLDAAISAGFERITRTVAGPLGAPVRASFALRQGTGSQPGEAVIELATASGLLLIDAPDRLPLAAHTRGTGELITAALDAGARRIVLAVGGSASTDGGTGMLRALGASFLDSSGQPLLDGGGDLPRLHNIDWSGLDPRILDTEFVLATDVDHVLTGPHGAARVFAPQKGATPDEVELLEHGLVRLAAVLRKQFPEGPDLAQAPGSGAAGGVGFGAMAALGAARRPGVDVVAEVTGLPRLMQCADLVITGEGSFDAQSLGGKTPVGVLRLAQAAGVPAILVTGRNLLSDTERQATGFLASYAIADRDPDPDSCMNYAARYLEQIGTEIGTEIGRTLAG